MDQNKFKLASIAPEHVESINSCQSNIKTEDGKEVVLIAYEKST